MFSRPLRFMNLLLNYWPRYDVDIICLSWSSVASTGEGGPNFSSAARLVMSFSGIWIRGQD
jgi:hypothetical protein